MVALKRMLNMCLKILVSGIALIGIALLSYFNASLYYKPEQKTIDDLSINWSALCHLRHLKSVSHEGAASDMQHIYPEGFIFYNTFYGLAWADFAMNLPKSNSLYQEALKEMEWAVSQVQSREGKRIFTKSLELEYGAFYSGWSNYLLGKKIQLLGKNASKEDIELFKTKCQEIDKVLNKNKSPYIKTYPNGIWPSDVMLTVASLSLHDRVFNPKYELTIDKWIDRVKDNLDEIGLIPHAVNNDGTIRISARGSSQSLMNIFLKEIDPEFGKQQFEVYKKHFLDYRLGLPGILEYPKGIEGDEDIDSGPVIWGIGGAGTIVGLRTMSLYGEGNIAYSIRGCIEGFGLPYTFKGEKKYLLGILPIADAFIAWSSLKCDTTMQIADFMHLKTHIISLLAVLIFVLFLIWFWK